MAEVGSAGVVELKLNCQEPATFVQADLEYDPYPLLYLSTSLNPEALRLGLGSRTSTSDSILTLASPASSVGLGATEGDGGPGTCGFEQRAADLGT